MEETASQVKPKSMTQFVTFWIEGNFIGVNILDVKEINTDFTITPIFHAPAGVKGCVNLRGSIYLIIDLRLALGLANEKQPEKQKLVIFKDRVGELFGIIADEVGDAIEVLDDQIESYSSLDHEDSSNINQYSKYKLINGVCKLPDSLMLILNAGKILDIVKEFEN